MDPNTQRKEGIFSCQAHCQQNILLCAEKENTIKKIVWTDNPPHKTIARHQLEAMEHRAVWVFRNESSQVVGAPELVQGCWMLSGTEGTELGTPPSPPTRSGVTAVSWHTLHCQMVSGGYSPMPRPYVTRDLSSSTCIPMVLTTVSQKGNFRATGSSRTVAASCSSVQFRMSPLKHCECNAFFF